jgi:serine/threonine protein kinase
MVNVEIKKDKHLCVHGNFARTCAECNKRNLLKITRWPISHNRYRNKKNVRYETSESGRMIAKYVGPNEGRYNNYLGLQREFKLLNKLRNTNLVPKVLDYKTYPDTEKPRARLLLEELPGKSVDFMSLADRREFVTNHAQSIIIETARALETINALGVHVVDINEGTFLFDTVDAELTVKILDLEMGYDTEENSDHDFEQAAVFLANNDPAYDRGSNDIPRSQAALAKSEMYLWAHTLMRYIAPRPTLADRDKIPSPACLTTSYRDYLEKIIPSLEGKLTRDARRQFTKLKINDPSDAKKIEAGESKFITDYVQSRLPVEIHFASLAYTLPLSLETAGIQLDTNIVHFLMRCLSYNLDDRPTNFSDLLNN